MTLSFAKPARAAIIAAAAVATLGTSLMTTPAEAGRRHHGAGLALGIGALVLGSALAHRHYRPRYYYTDSYYYRPYYRPYRVYSYRHYGPRRHWRHRHWRW